MPRKRTLTKAGPGVGVAYLRVSTDRQGATGLGIEAQRDAVTAYASARGIRLAAEYVEVESGANKARPELHRAIAHVRKAHGTLLIAKLDRLARNFAFLAQLLDGNGNGFEIVACDYPDANRLTLRIMAAVAEHEREAISTRTREAMAAAKRRGVRFGTPNPEKASRAATREVRRMADEHARNVAPVIAAIRRELGEGASATAVAKELASRGIRTARGGEWGAGAVLNIEKRTSRRRKA